MSPSILANELFPRRIVPSGIGKRPPSWLWLAFIPHIWIGVVLLGQLVLQTAWAAVGRNLPLASVRLSSRAGSKGGTIYELEYTWNDEQGSHHFDKTYLGESTWNTLNSNHSAGRVRALSVGREIWLHDVVAQGDSPWWEVAHLVPVVLIWDGAMALLVTVVWVLPRLNRRLYRIGAVAPGRITRTREYRNRGTRYYIEYRYEVNGRMRNGQMETTAAAYSAAQAGQAVHVLYNPNGGKRSIIYEYGGYEWADEAMRG
jgi:hypothetical protein